MNWAGAKSWWQGRDARERLMLSGGLVVCLLVLGWAFVWYPLQHARADLGARLVARQGDLAFLQQAAGELDELRQRDRSGDARREGKSLLALADASAREAGLGPKLERLEPLDDNRIRMRYKQADFDVLVAWLTSLHRQYGIRVADLSLDRESSAGRVSARLTLEEP